MPQSPMGILTPTLALKLTYFSIVRCVLVYIARVPSVAVSQAGNLV